MRCGLSAPSRGGVRAAPDRNEKTVGKSKVESRRFRSFKTFDLVTFDFRLDLFLRQRRDQLVHLPHRVVEMWAGTKAVAADGDHEALLLQVRHDLRQRVTDRRGRREGHDAAALAGILSGAEDAITFGLQSSAQARRERLDSWSVPCSWNSRMSGRSADATSRWSPCRRPSTDSKRSRY